MLFTSYEDNAGQPNPMVQLNSNTTNGLIDCYNDTEKYAKKMGVEIPENTKSDPADRIKQFRESIAWGGIEDKKEGKNKEDVRCSQAFKKSAILFIHSILSPTYGGNISIEKDSFSNLRKEKNYKGRPFFIQSLQNALYGEEGEHVGMKMNRDEIVYIYEKKPEGKHLIGLISANGPIPSTDYIPNFNGLKVDSSEGTASIVNALKDQDKEILKHYLLQNAHLLNDCDLYKDINENLTNIVVPEAIKEELKIEKLDSGFPNLPIRENITSNILSNESITVLPLYGEHVKLGYNLPTLLVINDDLPYAFIPPLTQSAVEDANNGKFEITSITINEEIVGDKLDSVCVSCEISTNKGFKSFATHTYTREQIWYVKQFPVISIYGIAPKFGWITRRNLSVKDLVKSPLSSDYEVMIDGLKDIEFIGLDFEEVEDDFSICCRQIPKWVYVKGNGNSLGAIPLRVDPNNAMQKDFKEAPLFIHENLPSTKKMKVAVDIGSSRSIVLFWENLMDESMIEQTLIENGQILKVPITSPIDAEQTSKEWIFDTTSFQPKMHDGSDVKGKTPIGIFPTSKFSDDANVLLYKSGRLVFVDAKNVSNRGGKRLISNIKSQMTNKNDKKKAMKLLIQGILATIIERALHLGCSDIDIRTSYLREQYNMMKKIWDEAKKQLEDRMPSDAKVNISINLCLPESLAIANMIKLHNGFLTGAGAALVDIGDFSTDIALFKTSDSDPSKVELLNNFSIFFAGEKILLNPILEYLSFPDALNVEKLFENNAEDDKQQDDIKKIYAMINKHIKEHPEKVCFDDDIKSNILCLMNRLKKGKVPSALQNLFDLGYVAEVLILKHLIKDDIKSTDSANFNINLFGGGSSHFTEQGNEKESERGFNWFSVLGRPCTTENNSQKGDMLAKGLFYGVGEEIAECLRSVAKKEKKMAEDYEKIIKTTPPIKTPCKEELIKACCMFAKASKTLKSTWHFQDIDSNNINMLKVFNMQENENGELELLDLGLWTDYSLDAEKMAMEAHTDDVEIFKIIFAYKMIYSYVTSFYRNERNLEDET